MMFQQILTFTVCVGVWVTCSAHTMVPCSTGADCGDRECCVDVKNGVIGFDIPEPTPGSLTGICVRMGRVGYKCHLNARDAWQKPLKLVKVCPCQPGLFCGPTGYQPDRYGQAGLCTYG